VLPHHAAGLDNQPHDIAAQASTAWEAAVCWDDEYALSGLPKFEPSEQRQQSRDRIECPTFWRCVVATISTTKFYVADGNHTRITFVCRWQAFGRDSQSRAVAANGSEAGVAQ
jgi:hypothetical protein